MAAFSKQTDSDTDRIVEFVLETPFETLPTSTVEATNRVILDTVACAIGATNTAPGLVVSQFKRAQGGTGQATLLVSGEQLPVASVSYVHSHLANVLDADETLLNRTHFASTIVMPALAMAEYVGASGADVVAAVALGFDVGARIGLSLRKYVVGGSSLQSQISGADWAALGTAAALGRLAGLSHEHLASAIGTAFVSTPVNFNSGTLNAGLFVTGEQPYWHKYSMYGAIAEAGVNAVELASLGFPSYPRILDKGGEIWRSFGAVAQDDDFLTDRLGDRWFIAETSLKPYPFCRHGHGVIDRFRQIVLEHGLGPEDVDDVEISIAPYALLERIVEAPWPDDPGKVMMSIRYTLWMVLNRVPPGPQWWDAGRLDDVDGQAFTKRIHASVEPEWRSVLADQMLQEDIFRRFPVRVEVAGRKGTWVEAADYPRGDPWAPGFALSNEELTDKVRSFCTDAIGGVHVRQLIAEAMTLEERPDVNGLVASCVAGQDAAATN